jgi:hypothetical protein
LLTSLALAARATFDPFTAVPRLVEERRWLVPLLCVMLTGAASGAVIATRLDAAREVIPKLEKAGELAKASEREISEQIEQAQRIALVAGVGKSVFGLPLAVLALAVALKIFAWLIGRKAVFAACFTVGAVAMLPLSIFHLVAGVVAWRQDLIVPAKVGELLSTSLASLAQAGPGAMRALGAVDFFNLWVALLLGVGFATAAKLSAWRGAGLGVLLYALFAAAVLVGLPGLGEPK